MADNDLITPETWKSPQLRQSIQMKIQETINKYGVSTDKSPAELERSVFQKGISKEQYLSSVARLIINLKNNGRPNMGQPGQMAVNKQLGFQGSNQHLIATKNSGTMSLQQQQQMQNMLQQQQQQQQQNQHFSLPSSTSGGQPKSTGGLTYKRGHSQYVCNECGHRCQRLANLKSDTHTHADLFPYRCRHCAFDFKTEIQLTRHLKTKAHYNHCVELGIIPVPTTIDDSDIDLDVLAKQQQHELSCSSIHQFTDNNTKEDKGVSIPLIKQQQQLLTNIVPEIFDNAEQAGSEQATATTASISSHQQLPQGNKNSDCFFSTLSASSNSSSTSQLSHPPPATVSLSSSSSSPSHELQPNRITKEREVEAAHGLLMLSDVLPPPHHLLTSSLIDSAPFAGGSRDSTSNSFNSKLFFSSSEQVNATEAAATDCDHVHQLHQQPQQQPSLLQHYSKAQTSPQSSYSHSAAAAGSGQHLPVTGSLASGQVKLAPLPPPTSFPPPAPPSVGEGDQTEGNQDQPMDLSTKNH